MLLNFKVRNYLSFKDEAGFSMEANKKIRTLPNNKNIIKLKDGEIIWLNKTAIFYGLNAGGKTNIFKGLDFLKYITLNSFKFDIEGGIEHQFFNPFLLDENTQKENIVFEMEFIIEKYKYKYFLELNEKEIVKEKLDLLKITGNFNIIDRIGEDGEVDGIFFGLIKDDLKKLNSSPRNNQTLISILANRDSSGKNLATQIVKFFRGLNFINAKTNLIQLTAPMLENIDFKETILNFINSADFNIKDIKQEEREYNEKEGGIIEINGQRIIPDKVVELVSQHNVYKNEKKVGEVGFNLLKQESEGTKRLFLMLGPILDTIQNNGILLIDEIDTHMHFLLVENLIKFFHGLNEEGKNNIGEAQFIFNTHNLDLMDLELFKKDQIFFVSKDYYGASEIYSLDDFKDIQIRNNSDIKKAYKLGVFGAIPILSDFTL